MKSSEQPPRPEKPWHEFANMAFDIDGTLLNSNIAHVWAWQDAFESENLFFPHLTMLTQMGLPGKHIIEKFSYAIPDEETGRRIAKKAGELYAERYVSLVAPYDGTYKLLGALKARKRGLYAITSASEKEAQAMLGRFKLNRYFDHVITAEDVEDGKPSPEPFLSLKEKLGTRAELLSFGDSPYDFKASTAAGIPFVFLGHGGYPREWFEKAYARFFNINEMLRTLRKLKPVTKEAAA